MTIHHRCPSEDTWKKLETLRNRVSDYHDGLYRTDRRGNDGLSHVSVCGHLDKIGQWGVRDVGTDPMTVRHGYDSPSSGSRSVIQ